jgi:hypothetical protein
LRRRGAARIAQEAREAAMQPRRLPASQFRQPAQLVARFAHGIVQGLVPGEAAREARGDVGAFPHGAHLRRMGMTETSPA